jgi:DNA adenine methylase
VSDFIKSPLNYIGGKYKILPQIFPIFPKDVTRFIDLFAGGANVGINSNADTVVLNDNLVYLIEMYEIIVKMSEKAILDHIQSIISEYNLSLTNTDGYNLFRNHYNATHNPIDLLILTFFSFNHQIRFNNSHQFNTPFGKNRSKYNESIKKNLIRFLNALHSKNIEFQKQEFDMFDFSRLTSNDFVYCDPPYLITVGSYNDGKRGFTGWGEQQEKKLLAILDELNSQNIRFALSNVITHKGEKNNLLENWISRNDYVVHDIDNNYSNSNYHTSIRTKGTTQEVLITNYTEQPKNIKR